MLDQVGIQLRSGGLHHGRNLHFEAKWSNLKDIAFSQDIILGDIAVDACARSAAAIADFDPVVTAIEDTMKGGDFRGVQTDITAARPSYSNYVSIQGTWSFVHASKKRN